MKVPAAEAPAEKVEKAPPVEKAGPKPVVPGSARWAKLVEIGSRSNWTLGDAALEIAPMGDHGANTGALVNLRKFAEEIGTAFQSLRAYRAVASAWPRDKRLASTSWSVHQALGTEHQDKIRPGMTLAQARELVEPKATTPATTAKAATTTRASTKVDEPDDEPDASTEPDETDVDTVLQDLDLARGDLDRIEKCGLSDVEVTRLSDGLAEYVEYLQGVITRLTGVASALKDTQQ